MTPVMKEATGDTRKTAAWASSSGLPIRPSLVSDHQGVVISVVQ